MRGYRASGLSDRYLSIASGRFEAAHTPLSCGYGCSGEHAMRNSFLTGAFCAFAFALFSINANAVIIDYSSSAGSAVNFNPLDSCGGVVGCIDFSPASNITITSGTASGFSGQISGTFGVGSITTLVPGVETASVSGLGTLSIDDGSHSLTATLNWVDIFTAGVGGLINWNGAVNLSGIAYSGSNTDLLALAAAGVGTQTASFSFTLPVSLTQLFESNTVTTATSFSGSISAVPIPAAAWLFGSAMLGFAAVARRKKP